MIKVLSYKLFLIQSVSISTGYSTASENCAGPWIKLLPDDKSDVKYPKQVNSLDQPFEVWEKPLVTVKKILIM